MQVDQAPDAGPSTGPHKMRITSAGSIKGYVSFAVNFLQNKPDRPLILHTLPRPPSVHSKSDTSEDPSRTLRPCTLTSPKLITVVEIIKRELIAKYEAEGRGKGKHKATGVWQYTETGLVPAELFDGPGGTGGEEKAAEKAAGELARVLGGKTRPKMTHHPFLQITLSTRPLGLEKRHDPDGHGGHTFITCQHITVPRRRKHGPTPKAVAQAIDIVGSGMGGDESMSMGEVISRDAITNKGRSDIDLGETVARAAVGHSAAPIKTNPTHAAQAASSAGANNRSIALKSMMDEEEEEEEEEEKRPQPALAAPKSDKPKKSTKDIDAKEKKRRRQQSNAIDAEFAMFGKSTKKKKPSKL